MAAPGKGSRWGSFLSQAVAGVESRLDNILTEAEQDQQQAGKLPAAKSPAQQAVAPKPASRSYTQPTYSSRACWPEADSTS